jgi:hypothetical protein
MTKEQEAILSVAHSLVGLAAECGKSGHGKLVESVKEMLGVVDVVGEPVVEPVVVVEETPAPVSKKSSWPKADK